MVLSCRHCYAPDELDSDADAPKKFCTTPSYASTFVYGDAARIKSMILAVEKLGPIPGISTWCERCASVSMVSHRYYRQLCVEVDGMMEENVTGLHQYYSRMLIGTEMYIQFKNMASHTVDKRP